MKKIISLFLVLAIAAMMCACYEQDTDNNGENISVTTTATSATTETTQDPARLTPLFSGVSRTNDGKAYRIRNCEVEFVEVEKDFWWDVYIYEPYTAIVTSEDGITELIRKYCRYGEDVLAQFDEEFFKENALVFVGTARGSSSVSISAVREGKIAKGEMIEIEWGYFYMPSDQPINMDMVSDTIILIVDKNAVDGTEEIKINNYYIDR